MQKTSILLKILLILTTILVVLSSIVLPKYLLNHYSSQKENIVNTAPTEYYLASNTLMAKQASINLTTIDRLKLVSGTWNSTYKPCDISEGELTENDAVKYAKEKLDLLYQANLFPTSMADSYNNWYSWDTSLYKYTDTLFNTYTVYLWHITFQKYDGSTTIEVYLTDNGALVNASINTAFYNNARALNALCSNDLNLANLLADENLTLEGLATNNLPEQSFSSIIYPDFTILQKDIKASNNFNLTSKNANGDFLAYQYETMDFYGIGFLSLPDVN